MKYLTLTISEELCLLSKYGLNSNELLVLRVLLLLQDDQQEELFQQLLKTLKEIGLQLRELLISLQEKGLILKTFKIPEKGSTFDPFSIPINKLAIKNLYKSSFEMGKELFESYPQWTTINKNLVSLRGVSRHFDSLEDCYCKYGKAIGWNWERHQKILELVQWGKEHNILSKSLGAFVVDNGWHDLESLKNGEGLNINFDSIRMI